MSEGPEVRHAVDRLREALLGEQLVDVVFRRRPAIRDRLVGSTVEACDAVGKNIILRFSAGLWLRNHMQMYGKWRTYPRAEFRAGRSRAPRRASAYRRSGRPDPSDVADVRTDTRVRLVLETALSASVQFNGPVLEFTDTDPRSGEALRRLGPDALAADFDLDEVLRRLRERGDATLADLVLDQTFVAGVGNKYKAELLFLLGMDPFRRASSLTSEQQARLVEAIPRLLRRGYENGGRTREVAAVGGASSNEAHWVYGRAGRPCHRCGTTVRSDQRRSARRTYFCPTCQAVRDPSGPAHDSSATPDDGR